MVRTKPKVLIFDIETSHNLVLTFELGTKQNTWIPPANIVTERHLFCIGYKWLGEKRVSSISIHDNQKRFKKDIHDDYHVLSEFRKVIAEADAIVYHNGDSFDLPMFNARLVYHNLEPLPKIPSIDTKRIAKGQFRFNSNSLDYLARFLGYKGKTANPSGLWIDAFNGDEGSLTHMAKYCRNDVDITEYVYKKLSPFMHRNPLNAAAFSGGASCPRPGCTINSLQWRGIATTASGCQYRRFQCKCGKWGQEKKQIKLDDPALVK